MAYPRALAHVVSSASVMTSSDLCSPIWTFIQQEFSLQESDQGQLGASVERTQILVKVWEQPRALANKDASEEPAKFSTGTSLVLGLNSWPHHPVHPQPPWTPSPGPSLSLKLLRLLSIWPLSNPITHLSLWHISYKTEIVIPTVPSFCSRLTSDKYRVTSQACFEPMLHNL